MSTAIDSARVGTTREIDNDYIITYIRRRYFLPSFFASLSCLRILFHIAACWYPPRNSERGYIRKEGADRNGQRACMHQVCILQSVIRGILELVHASEKFPRLRGFQRQVDKLVMIV